MARKPLVNSDSFKAGTIVTDTEKDKEKVQKEVELTKLVNDYIKVKAEYDEYDAIVKALNSQIKKLMMDSNLDSFSTPQGASVSLTIAEKKSFNEAPMIAWMKSENVALDSIRTKEYIDSDILEEAIYNGKIEAGNLVKMKEFEVVKKTPTLRINKKKGA